MFDLQCGQCPICLEGMSRYQGGHGNRAASVDHCHTTERVRGLVCWHCNIKRISDHTVETAKRLVTYLESDFDGRELMPREAHHTPEAESWQTSG